MSNYTSRKPNEQVKYLYRLNKNFKGDTSMGVNGIILNKVSWTPFPTSQKETLKHYIKSYENPKGIVDEYIHDPLVELAIQENSSELKFVHRKKIYSRDILVTYTRKQLEEIAREYLIDPKEKINSFLITKIAEAQDKYRRSLKEKDNFFDDTNKLIPEE